MRSRTGTDRRTQERNVHGYRRPFAEAKEVVGGFALLEVSGRDEAIQITRRFVDHFDDDATCHLHEVNLPLESETPAMKTLQRMNA